MGCGGSRADAIEPRYYESWTRETESTWLTNTDADPQQQQQQQQQPVSPENGSKGAAEAGSRSAGILEDSKSTQTCIAKSSSTSGTAGEKRTHCGTQCTKQTVNTTGTQKQHNGFRTTEAKWDKKKATKEVSVNATKTISQLNSNRRMTKNCVN
ncbi:hypothetical protein JRQ81_010551 [Phrynocephalus forsythii]|uniref:Brain and acute leukemia cytoplasmic protein n=1 Tax=Phrynocephalus forsythii TaxID=171643 RepID=A0A9Q0Y2T4_9SAUR|nr:hypothetical protein JRQ81_010551 [Phrynocephalus forsythii]